MKKILGLMLGTTILAVSPMTTQAASAAERCAIAWSHYTGWEPAGYIEDKGLAKKWGAKYGVDLSFTLIGDYIESVNQYTAGGFDGVTVTNMDGLTIPAVGGVDTTALVIGDFSNGNDGILINSKDGVGVKDLKGKDVKLVELSVSHYLLARALEKSGMSERDVKVVNTSDADLGGLISTSTPGDAFVTWNPILQAGRNVPGIHMVFDSSKIPGEIVDTIMVRTNVSDNCKKAVTGAWYEAMAAMAAGDRGAITHMAETAGGTVAEFNAQLKTTRMFYDAGEAAAFARSDNLVKTMDYVRKFSFDHGLFGDGADSPDFIGIAFPDGHVLGNAGNVKLRFDDSFMQMAAEGKL
ncbi:putative urea ABC transporter substrate-binding protein [Kordiimonas marina]|uniref:putative urea ABC transporter substrate-binding protein n=1 Tax=Kordiimonas marina TaxID=2872312 RepID=UPI001FF3540E|nr:putative urea ABC transporter substrate-binding protein [Kordiimonas marina]MCJ9430071.1 putative urea ABC transporter substrate-binding protein [Kordiimonas marina]